MQTCYRGRKCGEGKNFLKDRVMPINIEIVNCSRFFNSLSPEENAAREIKDYFQQELNCYPNAEGTLYILHNVSIFGYEVRDVDLILIGNFENFHYTEKVEVKQYGEVDALEIRSFICNIELKDLDHTQVKKVGTAYKGMYKRGEKNITDQAFKQMHSFRNYLKDTLEIDPYMLDFIWFRSLSSEQLKDLRGIEKDNAFSVKFSFKELLVALLHRVKVWPLKDGLYCLDSFKKCPKNAIIKLNKQLCEKREAKGLTKTKFELISQKMSNNDLLFNEEGDNCLKIISGRAGTGKTIKLLQTAFRLASPDNNRRCLLLTYNNALVSDIKRLIDYTDMPVGIDNRTVSIQTVDSFFMQILVDFGVIEDSIPPITKDYNKKLAEKLTFLDKKLAQNIKNVATCTLNWDYVLIDEAQDWPDLHKEIILKLYGYKRLIVADGVDQFIMSAKKQVWNQGLDSDSVKRNEFVVGMRQKTNLIKFINAFAKKMSLCWEVRGNTDLPGGRIDIYSTYNSDIHIDLLKHCKQSDCENYDILILVPPCRVKKDEDGKSYFANAAAYEKANIKIFDGTNSDNRHRYPTKDLVRVFQYDSCRGLEGWVAVCYEFDELIKYKFSTIEDSVIEHSYMGLDIEKGKKRYVYTWSLMPLTRPVDRLVITLNDPKSEIGELLKNLSEEFNDFIFWHIENEGK